MAFINEIYHFKKIFRDIEKATKKCVHLNGAIKYIVLYIYILLKDERLPWFIINIVFFEDTTGIKMKV